MVGSDSDNDSECFESAEESLDEEDKVEKYTLLKNNPNENESEKSQNDVLQSSKETVLEDDSVNLLSYRKRPERVKRTPSIPSPKVISKNKKLNETVFKTDVADVLFQDITSNLSKNINKSLYTLQQTSSNVKDLIFSTLPASSDYEEKGFVYDDIAPLSVDNDILSEETCANETINKNESLSELPKCESEKYDEASSQNSDNKVEVLLVRSTEMFSENNLMDKILEPETEDFNNFKIDQNTIKPDKLDSNLLTEIVSDNQLQTYTKKESLDNLKKSFEALKLNNKIMDIQVNSCKSVLDNFKNNLRINESEEPKCDKNKVSDHCNEGILQSVDAEIDNSDAAAIQDFRIIKNCHLDEAKPCDSLTSNKNMVKENAKTKLNTQKEKIDQCERKVDFNETEELKSVKMNEAGMKIHNKNENLEGEISKEDLNKKVDDGWDDFDFSDTEIEDVNTECAKQDAGDVKKGFDCNKVVDEIIKDVSKLPVKECMKEKDVIDGNAKGKESSKEDFDESWNWESWDDEVISTEEKKESENKTRHKNDSDDGSKWLGWDNFSQKLEEKQGNWNIGTWGVSMLLNKATAVTQGLSNVLEAGLGVPDPETFAKMQKEEERQLKEEMEKIKMDEQLQEMSKKNSLTGVNLFPVSGITNLVAGVTSKIVEHTKIQEIGSKVLTGGLDTLETFGKKTMEVLQDGDPGLRNKRAFLMGNNKPVLSQILREAREKAEREIKQAEEKTLAKKCHFEALFDDFQGMVHLEALEMLSRQYELKLEQLKSGMSSEELEDLEGVLEEVEQLCVLDDLDVNSSLLDFKTSLQMAVESLKDEISTRKIIQIHDNVNKWLEASSESKLSPTLLHQKVVSTVAELTAATVQEFLKAGELLSIKECRKTVDEVDALAKLTNILCLEINKVCEKFIIMIQKNKELDPTNGVMEKVVAVRNNSTSYIKQAFNLLIPILQAGAAF